MNLRVAKYFASVLPNDARAREYAKKRGLTRETVDKFMIGFAHQLLERSAQALRRATTPTARCSPTAA